MTLKIKVKHLNYFIIFLWIIYPVIAKDDFPIVLESRGGAPSLHISDKIVLFPESKVIVETHAPYPVTWQKENMIGAFEAKIKPSVYKEVQAKVKKLLQEIPKQYVTAGIYETIYFEDQPDMQFTWKHGEETALQAEIRQEFFSLKQLALKKTSKAMEVNCAVDKKTKQQLVCHYINIGEKNLTTINPLEVSESLSCLNPMMARVPLNPINGWNYIKAKPKIVKLAPKEKYKFSLKLKRPCFSRIVVSTAIMRANPAYKDYLLGELVSNSLR